MFQTYPSAWMTHYTQNGLVLQDPTVLWGFANQGRIDWADLEDTSPAKVMQQAADFGLKHGLTVALEKNDSLSIASFANQSRAFTSSEADALEDAVHKLHQITAPDQNLSSKTTDALRALSIKLTH
nr:autoinducer binding domain-containing protein [Cognatishimia sp. MH4019]